MEDKKKREKERNGGYKKPNWTSTKKEMKYKIY